MGFDSVDVAEAAVGFAPRSLGISTIFEKLPLDLLEVKGELLVEIVGDLPGRAGIEAGKLESDDVGEAHAGAPTFCAITLPTAADSWAQAAVSVSRRARPVAVRR